jgi:hypothetical protein
MSEHPPEETSGPEHPHPPVAEAPLMPRWVPIVIGVVLVALAALAVVTGLRYRDNTLVSRFERHTTAVRPGGAAPPGEPEPGASRVFSGSEGANVPHANTADENDSRASISGGPGGVSAIVRMTARRGMQIKSSPSDAVVYVNDVAVGHAREFDSEDEIYDFAAPGSYDVRVIAPGFRERHYVVVASDDASDEVALIDVRLEKEP